MYPTLPMPDPGAAGSSKISCLTNWEALRHHRGRAFPGTCLHGGPINDNRDDNGENDGGDSDNDSDQGAAAADGDDGDGDNVDGDDGDNGVGDAGDDGSEGDV